MSDLKRFNLPDVGEGLVEAEILSWHVAPGDTVTVNQIIVEIETAKAAVELPCPYAGVVTELLAEPGQTIDVGNPIIVIDVDPAGTSTPAASNNGSGNGSSPVAATVGGDDSAEQVVATLVGYGPKQGATKRRPRKATTEAVTVPAPRPVTPPPPKPKPVAAAGGYVPLAKPPVRKLAKELGVDLRTLADDGKVITREDVERAAGTSTVDTAPAGQEHRQPRGERRVPIRGVRRATAQAVSSSAFTAPHVTEFLTVDVTPMMELRAKLKENPAFRGVKITPLTFAAKAVCLAVRRTPDVNAVWDEDAGEIVYKDYLHLGIAAATPRGLVVPKVRDADTMSLRELATALEALTATARDGKTPPTDMVGGTFTITNVGVFGVDTGTPIINPGESAILALGAIRDMPWVVDGQVVPRKVCQLSLSFDHRVVDGQQGSEFLADVGALLADPSMAITY
jgi:2-oxoisovalerate dehydrogenase E2 component (dihydrolipoyl transacylase)